MKQNYKSIKFTSGTVSKLTDDYYTLTLFNKKKEVYKATLPTADAAGMILKYDSITLAK